MSLIVILTASKYYFPDRYSFIPLIHINKSMVYPSLNILIIVFVCCICTYQWVVYPSMCMLVTCKSPSMDILIIYQSWMLTSSRGNILRSGVYVIHNKYYVTFYHLTTKTSKPFLLSGFICTPFDALDWIYCANLRTALEWDRLGSLL